MIGSHRLRRGGGDAIILEAQAAASKHTNQLARWLVTSPELDSSTVHLLESVVSDFSDRCRRGENPSVEEYVAQHPQLGDQLRDVLPAMRMLRPVDAAGLRPARDEFLPSRCPTRSATTRS